MKSVSPREGELFSHPEIACFSLAVEFQPRHACIAPMHLVHFALSRLPSANQGHCLPSAAVSLTASVV
jgi:hypothetical protein